MLVHFHFLIISTFGMLLDYTWPYLSILVHVNSSFFHVYALCPLHWDYIPFGCYKHFPKMFAFLHFQTSIFAFHLSLFTPGLIFYLS